MNERELRERLNDAAGAFRFGFENTDRVVRRTRTRLLVTQALPAMLVVGAIVVAAAAITGQDGRVTGQPPAGPGPTKTVSGMPEDDYTIDLNTREMTPLPEAIRGSVDETARGKHYAASSDGALLAYVGVDEEGNPQIFIGGIDGSDIRQVTHDPRGAKSPAWSPDGTKIVYEAFGESGLGGIFVLDVATGDSTKLVECGGCFEPHFTPDGSSVLYTAGSNQAPVTRIVPVAGGKSRLFIGPGEGVNDAGGASLSPDGSLVTFMGSGFPESEEGHCGPCRFIANADGSNRRVIPGHGAVPAGTWSPDGSRIVVSGGNLPPPEILVVDVATREATHVADGSTAIWLDDHTLLVEVCADPAFPCG